MQLVRSHNFGHTSGDFLLLHSHEWDALWGLPAWATRLFLCLVAFGDFKAGTVRTSYGELLNALQPDQPAAGRRLPGVSLQQVRDMLRTFEKLLILGRDKTRNEAQQALFFQVAPRAQKRMPSEKSNRDKNRGESAKQPELTGQTRNEQDDSTGGNEQVFQEEFLNPLTPTSGELSTDGCPPDEQSREISAPSAGRGQQQAPRGGQNLAPAAHAPHSPSDAPLPPAEIARRAAALRQGLRSKKTDPPRGRAGRPPSGASTGHQGPADDG